MLQILSATFSKCPGTQQMKAGRIGEPVSGAACRARLNCTVIAALAHPDAQLQKEKVGSICCVQQEGKNNPKPKAKPKQKKACGREGKEKKHRKQAKEQPKEQT